ncbi:MAG: response regulator [Candidatus Heimdallarchaeota archaeon]|nr:response regulator [Candidatus Heimdallarchaeota archaeon]
MVKMCKILIAEDDPLIRNLFKEILKSKGYDIIVAVDGEDAIKVYTELKEKPDIIVLDFKMPKKDGLEVSKEILQRDPSSNILMITGDPRVDQNELLNHGVKYKEKPVKMDDFLREIHNIAEMHIVGI